MQKAIIIRTSVGQYRSQIGLDTTELNTHLSEGWRFVSAAPFGVSAAQTGTSSDWMVFGAILVIIEKP